MLTRMIKTFTIFLFAGISLIPAKVLAQEGDDQELVNIGIALGVSIFLPALIPLPDAVLHLERADIINQDIGAELSPTTEISQLKKFHDLVKVESTNPGHAEYGYMRSFKKDYLTLQTQNDSLRIIYPKIAEIMDLESSASRSSVSRIKSALGNMGFAVTFLMLSNFITNDEVSYLKTTTQVLAIAFGLSAGYRLVVPGEDEVAYNNWMKRKE